MSGTHTGGLKARETNIAKYGKDFYSRLGAKGGKATGAKGFALNPELARIAGSKGGKISKRGPGKKKQDLLNNSDVSILQEEIKEEKKEGFFSRIFR